MENNITTLIYDMGLDWQLRPRHESQELENAKNFQLLKAVNKKIPIFLDILKNFHGNSNFRNVSEIFSKI